MAGEKTALEIALETRPSELDAAPEQIDLLAGLGAPINDAVQKLRNARTGLPGRPLHSRNKRTLEMAAFLLSRYTSPLEVLAQIATAPIDELSASLGCTKLEALQEKRLAAIALKDHLHSKMPVAVDITDRKIIYLTIGDLPPSASGAAGEILDLTATDLAPAGDRDSLAAAVMEMGSKPDGEGP
jgi:hypothetical protein